jgi:hypothetical protein
MKVAAIVFGMSLVATAWGARESEHVELEGHVYRGFGPKWTAGPPAAGALVSTSLSAATTVTDRNGYFHLRTGARIAGDEHYTITVQSAGTAYRQRGSSGLVRGSDIVINPPDGLDVIHPPYPRRH